MIMKHNEHEIFSISYSQRNIWELEQLYPNSPMNNICTALRIKGRLDIALVTRCINCILEQDNTLRTRIALVDGAPYQYHARYREETFPFFDFSKTDKQGVTHWEDTVAQMAMPICDSPLYQFFIYKPDEESGGVLIKLHHMIADGWSLVELVNRLSSAYLALLSQETPQMEPMFDYAEHVLREREYLASDAFIWDREYWAEQISSNETEGAYLKQRSSANMSFAGKRLSFRFSALINHAIAAFCRKNRVAPFTVYCIALAVYLRTMNGGSAVCLGVPVVNRPEFKDKKTGGMYVSTLPFFVNTHLDVSAEEFVINLTDQWYDLLRHQRYPFGEILALRRQNGGSQNGLFDIALSYQDGKIFRSSDATMLFSGQWLYSGYQREQLVIHLSSLDGENSFSVDYDYLTQLYSGEDIKELHQHITRIISQILCYPEVPICQLNLLHDEEREKVLYTFNNTQQDLNLATVPQLLLQAVKNEPDTVALIFEGRKVTYEGLYQRVREIAAELCTALPEKEEKDKIIAICLPRGFDLVAAMLAVALSNNAWVVVPPELPKARAAYILEDCAVAAVITDPSHIPFFDGLEKTLVPLGQPGINGHDAPPVSLLTGDDMAYVVYTSGSMGAPKGVMINQASLANFSQYMDTIYANGGVLSVCNTSFDVFILETISALLCGRTVILTSEEQCNNPETLAKLIKNHGVSFFAMTPSRLEAYLANTAFATAMKHMECIVCGGEPLTEDLLRKLEKLTKARVYNQYGPSEATIGVSCKCVTQTPALSAGRPMPNCKLYVLDENLNPAPIGAVGEVYIGGLCVGRGYINNEEETKKCFIPNPFEMDQTMYRSGDMALYDKEGEIHILGRRDAQVKMNGHRIELQEVSAALQKHPAILQAAADVISNGNSKSLACYYVAKAPIREGALYDFCQTILPSYMIPSAFIPVETIPLTTNGKADLRSLPKLKKQETICPVSSKTLEKVLTAFEAVLERHDLSGDSDFFQNGGDSLNALKLISEITRLTGEKLSVADIRLLSTPAQIASKIQGSEPQPRKKEDVILPIQQQAYPLTATQESILFSSFSDPTGMAYNMPGGFCLTFEPDEERLQGAFFRLIEEEPILRTGFVFEGAQAVAHIADSVPFSLENIKGETYQQAFKAFARPFDLSKPPLLRAGLWRENGKPVLLIDVHHIISDGEGTPILLKKLDAYYQGIHPQKGHVFYKDYACYTGAAHIKGGQAAYWKSRLRDLGPKLKLPTDVERQGSFDYLGGLWRFEMKEEVAKQVDQFTIENRITPFALFAAAYGLVLAQFSGQQDLVIGTPVAGRVLPQTQDMLGPFIHTLPLRLTVDGTVSSFLQTVVKDTVDLIDHMDMDLNGCLDAAGVERGQGHDGLYNVMFSMHPAYDESFTLDGKPLVYLSMEPETVKMEWVLEAVQGTRGYTFNFEYAKTLFKKETIAFYGRCFLAAVEGIINNPGTQIHELDILSKEDRAQTLQMARGKGVPYADRTMDGLVDAYASIYPHNPAIFFGEKHVTFDELMRQSFRIAAQLQQLGVKPGDTVGVYCDRTPDLICGLFAVLKCGAAYLPLSDALPKERLNSMLHIARAEVVLCDRLRENVDESKYQLCVIGSETYDFVPVLKRSTRDTAQVLFTSGSTGHPKGIMIPHRALATLVENLKGIYLEGGVESVLCSSSVLFDSFTMEVIVPLASGIPVVLANEAEAMNPWLLAELIKKSGVQAMFSTPSRMRVFLGDTGFVQALSKIKVLLSGGEVMTNSLKQALLKACPGQIYNLYGPAEATVFVTAWKVTPEQEPTIGFPVNNAKVYILDEAMRQAMPGSSGEIFIGGECLASGYISRPDLTSAAFVDDPFEPGSRLYRTGDMGRMLVDGRIQYLGRKDFQVKLNGQRIELDEITGSILNTGMAADAAVVAIENPNGGDYRLWGFVKPLHPDVFSKEALIKVLSQSLPRYMVPSQIVPVEKIPHTATGKTDIRMLKALAAENKELQSAAKQPSTVKDPHSTKEQMLALWQEVLAAKSIEEDRSFFEQGGTSLAAMNLLVRYFKQGWQVKLGTFYDRPTFNQQLELIEGLETAQRPVQEEPEGILVTGATGFLGAHIVYELMEKGGGPVYCLVRGSEERLFDALTDYFGKAWVSNHSHRIVPFLGDIAKEQLGMDCEEYLALAKKVHTVYHCAADVRHYMKEEEAVATNVEGAKEIIRFCLQANAYLGFISTLSVAGERIVGSAHVNTSNGTVEYDEDCIDIGQNWQDNVYVRSKFIAEEEVRRAALIGLKARILRVGRLVGRAGDGKFQRNPQTNYFYNVITGILRVGAIPAGVYNMPLELTAVDCCARAAVLLMNGQTGTAHLANPYVVTIGQVAREMLQQAGAQPESLLQLSNGRFMQLILEKLAKIPRQSAAMLNSLLAMSTKEGTVVDPVCHKTVAELKQMGFAWEAPELKVLLKAFIVTKPD